MTEPQNSHSPFVVSDPEQIATPDAVGASRGSKPGPLAPIPADQAKRLIEEASANFKKALTSTAPVYLVVLGLDAISLAVNHRANLIDIAPEACEQIAEITHTVAARVSAIVGQSIDENEIYSGLGAAKGLVTLRDDVLGTDRALYVAVLTVDLLSYLYRSTIQHRGDPIMKEKRAEMADIARRAEAWVHTWPAMDTPRSQHN